jgi:tripartite-type tricarboxylate transporter receptor subunit TctC
VARAAPDGQTLMMTSAAFAQLQAMTKEPGYDAVKDFAPLVHFGSTPNMLVAHPSLPVRTLPELIAYSKTKPLTCATAAARLVQYFQAATGANISIVAYKAGQLAIQDTVSGHVDLTLPPLPDAMPHVQAGALRAIAVTGPKREARLPDIGTVAESAPGFRIVSWYGFTAPAGLPAATLERLRQELAAIVRTDEFRTFLTGRDITPTDAPDSLGEIIAADIALWQKLVVDLNIERM